MSQRKRRKSMSADLYSHDTCKLLDDSGTYLPTILPSTSCWAKFKRALLKVSIASALHPETHQYLKSQYAISAENRRQLQDYGSHTIIHPLSLLRNYWKIFMYCVMVVHLIVVPFIVSFSFSIDDKQITRFIYLDIFLCTILITEVPMGFITGYIVPQNKDIILERRQIVRNYLKRYFIIDIFGALPYVVLLHDIRKYYLDGYYATYILYNIYIYIFNLVRFNQLNDYFLSIPHNFRLSEKCVAILRLSLSSFYLLHWTCCLRYPIVNIQYFILQYQKTHPGFTVFSEPPPIAEFTLKHLFLPQLRSTSVRSAIVNSSVGLNYVRSCMFTAKTALLVGNALEANNEFNAILISYYIIIGGFIWSSYCLFTGVQMVFSTDISTHNFEEFYEEIQVFCQAKKLPLHLRKRLLHYYKHRYRGHYFNEVDIKSKISGRLKKEILMHTCHSLVASVKIFANLPHTVIEQIIEQLIYEIYLPKDIIVKAGTEGDAMYMIAFGTACVVLASGAEINHLHDGDYFGEISILFENQKRIASVIAIETCEVYKLTKQDFQLVVAPHKNLLTMLRDKADERMSHSAKLASSKQK